MKFAGHTMGTPKLDIFEAMKLFNNIGYDGIEVRVAPNGQIDSETVSDDTIKKIRDKASELNLEISCLTSYYKDFVTEKSEIELKNYKRVIEIAEQLNCPNVRSMGGIMPPEGISHEETLEKTIIGVKEAAQYANTKNIAINVETHIGSLTFSVQETIDFVKKVNEPNVGILFDYAWVYYKNVEKTIEEAISISDGLIRYCHAKNWHDIDNTRPNDKKACLIEEGEINWEKVINALIKSGYDGYICNEYEKYWDKDGLLPEPEIGMKKDYEYLKLLLN